MLTGYLTATAIHKPQTDTNNRGEPVYGPPVSISCRCQVKTQEIRTPDKQVIKADYVYYVRDAVVPGDLLDGRLVQLVEEWAMLGGRIMGFKAVV
ncbi:MAG: hypothetical protein FH749_07855 [Firmicutes bacterium]|nr:hypothetical protein [Bacillota bacterium]